MEKENIIKEIRENLIKNLNSVAELIENVQPKNTKKYNKSLDNKSLEKIFIASVEKSENIFEKIFERFEKPVVKLSKSCLEIILEKAKEKGFLKKVVHKFFERFSKEIKEVLGSSEYTKTNLLAKVYYFRPIFHLLIENMKEYNSEQEIDKIKEEHINVLFSNDLVKIFIKAIEEGDFEEKIAKIKQKNVAMLYSHHLAKIFIKAIEKNVFKNVFKKICEKFSKDVSKIYSSDLKNILQKAKEKDIFNEIFNEFDFKFCYV